jgi:hypothetical protein
VVPSALLNSGIVISGRYISRRTAQDREAPGFVNLGLRRVDVDDVSITAFARWSSPSAIAAELSGRHAKCRPAATSPACQPGARPPVGGLIESTSIPVRASSQGDL